MLSEFKGFTKENMDIYFSELSKELKKEFGRGASFELIVAGGASVMMNYSFRESTQDIDAVTSTRTSIKDAVNRTGDRLGLPDGWLNSDFTKTASYSPNLVRVSRFYRTYNQVLTVRTVSGEYLIAMKLASMRPYKNDKSDIIGIIHEHRKAGRPVTYESVRKAAADLYGKDKKLNKAAETALKEALSAEDTKGLYEETRMDEDQKGSSLKNFEREYPGILTEKNLDSIINSIEQKEKSIRPSPHPQRMPEMPEPVQGQDETE